jgi:hypothetical protein
MHHYLMHNVGTELAGVSFEFAQNAFVRVGAHQLVSFLQAEAGGGRSDQQLIQCEWGWCKGRYLGLHSLQRRFDQHHVQAPLIGLARLDTYQPEGENPPDSPSKRHVWPQGALPSSLVGWIVSISVTKTNREGGLRHASNSFHRTPLYTRI